jgi:hypothetical protein
MLSWRGLVYWITGVLVTVVLHGMLLRCVYMVWPCINCTTVLCTRSSTGIWHYATSRAIRRIVRDKMYWFILWYKYQSTLYISTRKAILWSHGIAFRRTLPVNFCGKCRITQLAIFRTPLAVNPYSTSNVSFFGTVAPLFLFLPSKLCSLCLWVVVLLVWGVLIDLLNQSTLVMSLTLSFLVLPSCWYCFLRTVLIVLSRATVFLSVQYASTTTDLPSTPLWHSNVRYCVDHIVQHHNYLCTSTVVQLLSTNHHDTVLQYTHWLHNTGAVPLHDM